MEKFSAGYSKRCSGSPPRGVGARAGESDGKILGRIFETMQRLARRRRGCLRERVAHKQKLHNCEVDNAGTGCKSEHAVQHSNSRGSCPGLGKPRSHAALRQTAGSCPASASDRRNASVFPALPHPPTARYWNLVNFEAVAE